MFRAAFYLLFWGLLGPWLHLKSTRREEGATTVAQRVGLHALFGLVKGLVGGRAVSTWLKSGEHFLFVRSEMTA